MILILLLFIAALALEGIGTYISVIGLAATFAADPIILTMAVVLDFCKVIAVNTLAKTWSKLTKTIKTYMIASTIVLSIITSAGVAGYLSNSFQKAMLPNQGNNIALVNLTTEQERLLTRKKEIDVQISQLPPNQVRSRQRLMNSFKPETDHINKRLIEIDAEKPKLQATQATLHTEVGAIMYLAEVADIKPETAVGIIIMLIIFVFDPMAIVFLITANRLLNSRKEEAVVDEPPEPPKVIPPDPTTKDESEPIIEEDWPEHNWNEEDWQEVKAETPDEPIFPSKDEWDEFDRPAAEVEVKPELALVPIEPAVEHIEPIVEPEPAPLQLELTPIVQDEPQQEPDEDEEEPEDDGDETEFDHLPQPQFPMVTPEAAMIVHEVQDEPPELEEVVEAPKAEFPVNATFNEAMSIVEEPHLEEVLKEILQDSGKAMTQAERERLDRALDRIFAADPARDASDEPHDEDVVEVLPEVVEVPVAAPVELDEPVPMIESEQELEQLYKHQHAEPEVVVEEVVEVPAEPEEIRKSLLDDPALDNMQGAKSKYVGDHWINPKLLEIYSKNP